MVNLVPLKKWKTTKDDVGARNKRDRGGRFSSACVSIPCAVLDACATKHTHPNHPSSIDQIWNQIFAKEKNLCLEGCLKDDIRVDISPDVVKLKLGGIIVESREKPAFAGGSDCDGERRGGRGGAIVVWSDQLDSWGHALPLEREGGSESVKGIKICDLMQENKWDD